MAQNYEARGGDPYKDIANAHQEVYGIFMREHEGTYRVFEMAAIDALYPDEESTEAKELRMMLGKLPHGTRLDSYVDQVEDTIRLVSNDNQDAQQADQEIAALEEKSAKIEWISIIGQELFARTYQGSDEYQVADATPKANVQAEIFSDSRLPREWRKAAIGALDNLLPAEGSFANLTPHEQALAVMQGDRDCFDSSIMRASESVEVILAFHDVPFDCGEIAKLLALAAVKDAERGDSMCSSLYLLAAQQQLNTHGYGLHEADVALEAVNHARTTLRDL